MILIPFICCSWLIKHPGFNFDLKPRDPSCLPKEYTNAEGTCYFLEGYTHPTVHKRGASLVDHINVAMEEITEDKIIEEE